VRWAVTRLAVAKNLWKSKFVKVAISTKGIELDFKPELSEK